jgi:hypothetical protein
MLLSINYRAFEIKPILAQPKGPFLPQISVHRKGMSKSLLGQPVRG